MLEYEWGNASSNVILSGADEQLAPDSDHRQIFNNYQNLPNHNFMPHTTNNNHNGFSNHHNHFLSPHPQQYVDPNAYTTPYQNPVPGQMLALDPTVGAQFLVSPKHEEIIGNSRDFNARIGLNLGHRTYFSSDDDFVNRLYRRSRPGLMDSGPVNTPRCQAEGCVADLTHAKHYHRRHKVCEFHSKASTVIAAGVTQRFCQQCSRFHLLPEFDNGKRSCRKRLADHNRRRRKSQQQPAQDQHQIKSPHPENGCSKSSSETLTRSPADSGAHSLSSVTVAVSPPRMSLDCFRQRSYNNGTMSSGSSNLLFYSNE